MTVSPEQLARDAEDYRRRANELDQLAKALQQWPNAPTELCKQILVRHGFAVLHQETIRALQNLVAFAFEQDSDHLNNDELYNLDKALKEST